MGVSAKKKVLDLKPPRSYTYPASKAYCLLYYRKKLKDVLEPEYQTLIAAGVANDQAKIETQIAFINRRCADMLAAESPEVQAEVEEYVKQLKEEGRLPEPAGDDPESVEVWNARQQ